MSLLNSRREQVKFCCFAQREELEQKARLWKKVDAGAIARQYLARFSLDGKRSMWLVRDFEFRHVQPERTTIVKLPERNASTVDVIKESYKSSS